MTAITDYRQYLPKIENPRVVNLIGLGYPDYDLYEDGRIWSKKSDKFLALKWRYGISGSPSDKSENGDYLVVSITQNGKPKCFYIHRLLATYFVDNPKPNLYKQVDHLNGLKWDNRLSNLEWCNKSNNNKTHMKRDSSYLDSLLEVGEKGRSRAKEVNYKPVKRTCTKTGETKEYQCLDRVRDDGFDPSGVARMANQAYHWEWIQEEKV